MSEKHELKESTTNTFIGWAVIILSFIAGSVFILIFGQIESQNDSYDTVYVWSGVMVAIGLGIILNGLLFGYLILKVSSILQYHEQRSITNIAE